MAFATTKDSMLDHEKFLALESDPALKPIERMAAGYLWAKVNTWCAKHRTDGAIPLTMVVKLAGDAGVVRVTALRLADAIVRARGRKDNGLWEPRENGFQVHDYTDHNYSAATIEALRRAGSVGGKKSAKARAIALAKAQANGTHGKQSLKPMVKQELEPKVKPHFKQVSNPNVKQETVIDHENRNQEPLCPHVKAGEPMCEACERGVKQQLAELGGKLTEKLALDLKPVDAGHEEKKRLALKQIGRL